MLCKMHSHTGRRVRLQIHRFSQVMGLQLLEMEETNFSAPTGRAAADSAVVRVQYLSDGSDNKFVWKEDAITGQVYRSPSHLVPMSHFDLLVRGSILYVVLRTRPDVLATQQMLDWWEDQLASPMTAQQPVEAAAAMADEEQQGVIPAATLAKHRAAVGGGISTKAMPVLCETPALRIISQRVQMTTKPLHDSQKNMSKALHEKALVGMPSRRHHLPGCPHASEQPGDCGCPVIELRSMTKSSAVRLRKQLLTTAVNRSAFDFGLKGHEWRLVIARHQEIEKPVMLAFTLQQFELHDIYLSLTGQKLLPTAAWKVAEYAGKPGTPLQPGLRPPSPLVEG